MKFKSLILKFGFVALEGVCDEKGWRIPSRDELRSVPSASEHKVVWVSDLPPKEEDRATHAMLFDMESGELALCNKNFMQHVVVIVEDKER